MRKCMTIATVAAVVLACVSGVQADVVMETVPVGNLGNAGELSGLGAGGNGPDRICGAVDYAYNIGKYEVTAGQYAEFLNAVAATDTYELYSSYMDSSRYGCQITRHGSRLGKPSGELRLLGRLSPLHQLAAQRSGQRRHGDGLVQPERGDDQCRTPGGDA